MLWYRSNNDGTAHAHHDSPALRKQIDREGGRDWYMTPEGAIRHGHVRACAFIQRSEQLFDAMAWLHSGQMVPMGERIVTIVTCND